MYNLTMSNHNTLSVVSDELTARFCRNDIDIYVNNMTKTYTDTGNEASMVAASVIMFALAGLFFNLNLFSRLSDVSAILDPKVRLFLTSGLSLFLPVMSYLFSEAKNTGVTAANLPVQKPDLSLHAGMILVWMLLVELLRKKVDEVRMRGYSGTIQRAGRVVWLGSLVFFNIRNVGRKAVFGILWVLCATKVVQRIAFTEVGKRSYACGKNSRLVSSYMSQILLQSPRRQDDQQDQALSTSQADVEHEAGNGDVGDALLKRSKFLVMGEEDLVIEPTADGYKLKEITHDDTVVTVGKIWSHAATGVEQANRLKRLCLSFALFKLLRRRFEHLPPVTKEETNECRVLIFKGIYNDKEDNAEAVFQMMNDEVNFLCEYYHSVIPVVLASPFFCLTNYFLLPLVVLGLCIMTVVLCGQGDAFYAFHGIERDNYAISSGIFKTTVCLLAKALSGRPQAFFTAIDFFITMLLFVILFYEEIWEFLVFLLSNWFMVSLLCNYVAKPRWQRSPTFKGSIHRILWVRGKMSQPTLTFKQFSILGLRWPLVLGIPPMFSLLLQTVHVPNKAKHSIIKSLIAHSSQNGDNPLNNGKSVLARTGRNDLLPACRSESIAEVILTWHIATTLMEAKCPPSNGKHIKGYHTVATRLSRYCAYLVAFHPELLPDNQEKTERVFEAAKAELKGALGCGNYFLSCWRMRVDRVAAATVAGAEWKDGEVVHNGAKLGNMLRGEATISDGGGQMETIWKLLADVWTELVVYLAPSSDEERVMGHESVLVQGGEFITVLWALATHTGITRT